MTLTYSADAAILIGRFQPFTMAMRACCKRR